METKYSYKIVVIGDPAVGKTSLIYKYTKGHFKEDYIQTIGAQLSKYDTKINENICQMVLWDIAGQDTFHFLRPAFYKGGQAAIIVFSLEKSEHGKLSLEHVEDWHNNLKNYCGDIPIILLGNKLDLIDDAESVDKKAAKLAEKRGFIGYYKTSAKTGEGVVDAFQAIIQELYNKYSQMKC